MKLIHILWVHPEPFLDILKIKQDRRWGRVLTWFICKARLGYGSGIL